jgi:HAD superfamily hydrolase (TIGR01459 family)
MGSDMQKLASIHGFKEIADQFEVFLLDQFGVLHDGKRPYPGVLDAIEELQKGGKQLIVLTNSGKRSALNLRRLVEMGFPERSIQAVISSGEVAWRGIQSGLFRSPYISAARAFIVGRYGDDYGFDDLGLEFVDQAERADFILILGSDAPRTSLDEYSALLRAAAQRKVPALCANPDIWMIASSGLEPAPGAIAELYKKLGGTVRYIGKPYADIYELALANCSSPNKARVIAVGDSVEHDVKGAKNFGLASVLVRGGVSSGLTASEMEQRFLEFETRPDWEMPVFAW